MSDRPNEALKLTDDLKVRGLDHDGPDLDDLHVLSRYCALVAARGFEINDEIALWLGRPELSFHIEVQRCRRELQPVLSHTLLPLSLNTMRQRIQDFLDAW